MQNQELLEYSIEKYDNNIEENEIVSNALQNFENEKANENEEDIEIYYNRLNADNLTSAFSAYNYPIITSCLDKFVFLAQNLELFNQHNTIDSSFIFYIIFDLEHRKCRTFTLLALCARLKCL